MDPNVDEMGAPWLHEIRGLHLERLTILITWLDVIEFPAELMEESVDTDYEYRKHRHPVTTQTRVCKVLRALVEMGCSDPEHPIRQYLARYNIYTSSIRDETQTFDYLPELIPAIRLQIADQNGSEEAVLRHEPKDENLVDATTHELVEEREPLKRMTNTESGEGGSVVRKVMVVDLLRVNKVPDALNPIIPPLDYSYEVQPATRVFLQTETQHVLFSSMMWAIEETFFSFGVNVDYQGLLSKGIDATASLEAHHWWRPILRLEVDPGTIRDPVGTSPAFLRTLELERSPFAGNQDRLSSLFFRATQIRHWGVHRPGRCSLQTISAMLYDVCRLTWSFKHDVLFGLFSAIRHNLDTIARDFDSSLGELDVDGQVLLPRLSSYEKDLKDLVSHVVAYRYQGWNISEWTSKDVVEWTTKGKGEMFIK